MKYKAFLLCIVFVSCVSETTSRWEPIDLLPHGYAITVAGPDSVEVKTEDLLVQQGLTLRNDTEKYFVQMWIKDASTTDMERLKAQQILDAENHAHFSKIIHEDPDGIIFEKKLDSTHTNYDFRYVKVQGDKEYVFQTGLIGSFSEEEVRKMYKAVRAGGGK